MTLAARVLGVGLVGPGLAGWREAREVLAERAAYSPAPTVIPSPDTLPPTERRRAGKCVRLALAAGLAAAADAAMPARELAAVFASSTGDGENQHAICEVLASDDRAISPTRFHNSVHNAPAGYWGIATGSMMPIDSVAAFDATFGAGLIEALGRVGADPARAVLLVAYDAPYPEPLHSARPVLDAFGVGLLLGAAGAGPAITVEIARRAASPMSDEALERVRRGIPAARSLPLLRLIAQGVDGSADLEYVDGLALGVAIRA
jgi:hypothetical protein